MTRDNVLERKGFFDAIDAADPSSARKAAFSISELVLRNLKLSLGRKVLIFGLFFDEEGPGDSLLLGKIGLGHGEKITLLGGGVRGMFILT